MLVREIVRVNPHLQVLCSTSAKNVEYRKTGKQIMRELKRRFKDLNF